MSTTSRDPIWHSSFPCYQNLISTIPLRCWINRFLSSIIFQKQESHFSNISFYASSYSKHPGSRVRNVTKVQCYSSIGEIDFKDDYEKWKSNFKSSCCHQMSLGCLQKIQAKCCLLMFQETFKFIWPKEIFFAVLSIISFVLFFDRLPKNVSLQHFQGKQLLSSFIIFTSFLFQLKGKKCLCLRKKILALNDNTFFQTFIFMSFSQNCSKSSSHLGTEREKKRDKIFEK